ncbi:hypothetical protein OAA33_00235 [Candidatus Pelagibacter sp.]|nr:hypothetical protein [Candidatus Pelagibacter sp.]
MKKIVKNFNNFIKKTIFKVENKTNDNFLISTFNKYTIATISILFIYIFYLLIPLLYDKVWVQDKIISKLNTEFNINLSHVSEVTYRILPKPHYLIKDSKTSLAKIKSLNIFISQKNFFDKDSINIKEVAINGANFSLLNENFKILYNNSDEKFSEKKITINSSNIFFRDNLSEVNSIIKISKASLFFDDKNLLNIFDLKGEIFNIPFKLKYQNLLDLKKKRFEIKAPDLKLQVINEIFEIDENLSNGINNISILSSAFNTKYNIDNSSIVFQSGVSRVHNSKIDYSGQLTVNPFDLDLKINLPNYKISNLFKSDSIVNEFIKSELLFNKNISVSTLVNIKSKIKDEIFDAANVELRILNGKINFDNTRFINKNIGLLEISDSDLFLKNDRLILTANLGLSITNINKLFSFLNTNKRSRKDIKDIKFKIIYDFLSNQIEFKNIKVNNNEVSDQFNYIVEGFSNNNSNNLTKSRRLLNELIDLYEG